MVAPLYRGAPSVPPSTANGHKGLWFDRFFNKYNAQDWTIGKEDKKKWIDSVAGFCGDTSQLKFYSRALAALCHNQGGKIEEFQTTWRFATGLGNPHPVENGFAWHPTLGVPYLTGAAVKGLVRDWVEIWMEVEGSDEKEQREKRLDILYRWFGSEDKDPKARARFRQQGFQPPSLAKDIDTEAGMFVFFDAIPTAPVELGCDVMTPHYGKWYEEGGNIGNVANEPQKVPADWHSPVPVPFLVVKKANFLFCIAPRRRPETESERISVEAELDKVITALADALQYLGAGAKTAVGYGRFEVDADAKARRAQVANQARLQELRPDERLREEVLQIDKEQLARMFGKDFNSTQQVKGENWSLFLELVREIHGELIKTWKSSPNKNMKKAYNKLVAQ